MLNCFLKKVSFIFITGNPISEIRVFICKLQVQVQVLSCQIIVTCKPGDFGNILLEIIISQLILTLTVGSFYCKCLFVINIYNCICKLDITGCAGQSIISPFSRYSWHPRLTFLTLRLVTRYNYFLKVSCK